MEKKKKSLSRSFVEGSSTTPKTVVVNFMSVTRGRSRKKILQSKRDCSTYCFSSHISFSLFFFRSVFKDEEVISYLIDDQWTDTYGFGEVPVSNSWKRVDEMTKSLVYYVVSLVFSCLMLVSFVKIRGECFRSAFSYDFSYNYRQNLRRVTQDGYVCQGKDRKS